MSGRIETFDSRKEQTSKWSQNEAFSVREAGVDIGKSGGQGGSNVSVDQVVTSGREVAGVTVDGERTPILIPNAGEWTQSDWAESDPSDDAYIKNKPMLAQVATSGDYGDLGNTPDLSNFVEDSNYVHTDNNYDAGAKNIVDHVTDNLANKVDKVTGKTLSDNNFTNAQKDKLTNLADIYGVGANLTLDPETNILSANAQPITIDDEMSSSSTNAVQNRVITGALADKVDKVTGKVLSDNNFSNSDKQKLDGIDQGAEVNDISTISVNGVNVPADANKNVEITIPTKVSDLSNDSGFVTNTVNNLANYYLKSETYTQSEVDSLISAIVTLDIKAVATLPTTGISTTTIYLVPSSDPDTQNVKDEYINITGDSTGWELIGSTKIDLTGYVTDTELATALADYVTDTELTTALANYVTTTAMSTALADKVDISDVDQTYDPTSANPQSGIAVAAAVAGGGGGLLPHLIIISEDGESEVKAVKGSTEIIATRTSAGHYECDVPEFGTWTIHAVLNGDDAIVNLVVDTVKVYTVDDSHFHADITVNFPVWEATCNIAGQGESYYATSDPYTFTVHSAGTYTITVVEGSNTYTDTVEVTATGQTFSKVIPAPADAPLDNINYWLWYGGIDNSEGTYSTLADILADTTALSTLMASRNAVDYMVRNTSWATYIYAVEDAMTYIGLNNYCANTLLAETTTWRTSICNSLYFEKVLNTKNPVMTSATAPEGEVLAYGVVNGTSWQAFNGDTRSGMCCVSAGNSIGYRFTRNVPIYKIDVSLNGHTSYQTKTITFKFQAVNSSTGVATDITDPHTGGYYFSSFIDETYLPHTILTDADTYRYYCVSGDDNRSNYVYQIYFYGREDV